LKLVTILSAGVAESLLTPLLLLLLFMSMGWDYVSEVLPLTGLFLAYFPRLKTSPVWLSVPQ
jgi:hypothetical protein